MYALDDTHDPALESWVESANRPGNDFPIQNLPFAVFRRAGSAEAPRGAVAIGEQMLDLRVVHELRVLRGSAADALEACTGSTLNAFMAMGAGAWSALRKALSACLRRGSPAASALRAALLDQADAEFVLPAYIGDYTDFYTSIHHATAVGRLFRPDNPLLPNYKWVPVAYHGRASSIRVSEHSFARPMGQILPAGGVEPVVGPSARLDYELEVGIFIGAGNALGTRVPIERAEEHVFGLCLLNDWSARDIQAWEYQPLGPFLAKNFATTISPWIVTLEALAPFRVPWSRPAGDPQPLPYLDAPQVRARGGIDVQLEVALQTQAMRARHDPPHTIARSSFRHAYWTVAHMVTHHAMNGCNLEPGDLLGSGTQSGPAPEEAGSLLELTAGGRQPLVLPDGDRRTFLLDGDRVVLRGWCERGGAVRIGFGKAAATVLPAAR